MIGPRSGMLAGLLLTAATGCAHFKPPQPLVEDVQPRIAAQKEEIVGDYEARRNAAELQAARTSAEHGDLSTCATALENILRRDASHREARLLLADVQLARENVAAAEQLLVTLVRDYPQDAASHHALALLLESTGRGELAKAHFQQAATIDPLDPLVALSADGNRETAGKIAAIAATAATVALATSPTPEAAAARAIVAAAQTPQGQELIRQALSLLERGEKDGALAALRQACELEPLNSAIPLAASVHLLRMEQSDAAIVLLEAAAERLPRTAAILRGLGAAYLQAGDLPAAQVVLQQALSLDSTDALSYFLTGQVLHLQGRVAEARQALRAAAELDSRFVP